MLHSVLQLLEGNWHLDLTLADAGEVDGEAVALRVKGEHQVVGVVLPPQLQLGPQNNVFTPHTWSQHRQKLRNYMELNVRFHPRIVLEDYISKFHI